MPLCNRLIAKLLIEDSLLVKYKNFTESRRVVGNPVSTAKILSDMRVDEFMIVDVCEIQHALVRDMTDALFTPVTVAGSIKSVEQAADLIRECGADKVVVKDRDVADDIAIRFGRQAVVWTESYYGDASRFDIPDCVGEVVLTSIDRDGCGIGFDTNAAQFSYDVPVVLSGGCGKFSHVKDAFDAGANGVAISTMWMLSARTAVNTRSWLVSEGCEVRAV